MRALYGQHDLEAALDHHRQQLALSTKLGDQYNQARAHDGIARCSARGGQTARAKRHWELAFKSYSELGNPAASDIASRLAELHTSA